MNEARTMSTLNSGGKPSAVVSARFPAAKNVARLDFGNPAPHQKPSATLGTGIYMPTKQQGSSQNNRGVFDVFLKPVTASKYGNERHAISLDPHHFLAGYNFAGPGTELKQREARHDDSPLNSFDAAAKTHDYAYAKEGREYAVDRDYNKHMEGVWNADKDFIKSSFLNGYDQNLAKATGSPAAGLISTFTHGGDPVMGTAAAVLMAGKMAAEKLGLMSSKSFSGIDPDLKNKPYEHKKPSAVRGSNPTSQNPTKSSTSNSMNYFGGFYGPAKTGIGFDNYAARYAASKNRTTLGTPVRGGG